MFFVFMQKTAYEVRISDWSSDVCSSDLRIPSPLLHHPYTRRRGARLPALGHCPDGIALDRRDAEHGHARQPAMLVECPPRCHVDQPLVRHFPEQCLERDAVRATQREMIRKYWLDYPRRMEQVPIGEEWVIQVR